MPKLRTETFGSGDQSWLGSAHGIRNARTATIDISTFTKSTHFPNGYIPSGTPVNVASEGAVLPWTAANGEKLGFVLTDQKVIEGADFAAPILRHGIINVPRVPVPGGFTAPATAAGFVFVGGN